MKAGPISKAKDSIISRLLARRSHGNYLLAVVMGCYLVLSLAYGWLNPIFEAPDELWHFLYVDELQRTGSLPIQTPDRKEVGPRQEGSQPPLYYLIAALVTSPIHPTDLPAYQDLNFRHRMGDVFATEQRNVVYHTERENIFQSTTALSVHVIRIVSTTLGALTVLLTYAIARVLMPGSRTFGLGAAALVAFLPQFVFISASVNNDNLAIAASTACLWLTLLLIRRRSRALLIALGLVFGVALLAKLSSLILAPLVAYGVLWPSSTGPPLRRRLLDAAFVGIVASLIAGWWYARNLLLYGEPLGLSQMLAMVGNRPDATGMSQLLSELWMTKASFWAIFGWTNVVADGWYYSITDVIMGLGILGLLYRLLRGPQSERPKPLFPLFLLMAVALAAFANWNRLTVAPQGRLLFTAIAPFAILLVWGMQAYKVRRIPMAAFVTPVVVGLLAAYALIAYLVPSYTRLPIVEAESIRPSLAGQEIDFGNYRLQGYSLQSNSLHPGDAARLSLFWQRLSAPTKPPTRFVHLERSDERFSQEDDAQLGTDIPAAVWGGTHLFREDITLVVPEDVDAPVLADLTVGLYDDEQRRLEATDANGKRLGQSPILSSIRIVPNANAKMLYPGLDLARFAGEIALADARLVSRSVSSRDSLSGELIWRALAVPKADYSVFVHLARDGAPVAQYDAQPRQGRYPTSVWLAGDVIPDRFVIHPAGIDAGAYRLLLGLYDPATGQRLAASGGNSFDLGEVTIKP